MGEFVGEGRGVGVMGVLVIMERISVFIEGVGVGVGVRGNISGGDVVIDLMGGGRVVLIKIKGVRGVIRFIIVIVVSIVELGVGVMEGYVLRVVVSV